ncbi:MAG TPA: discoidin domain-containing protein [Candidatus Acidoferrum sp.]|nr:discoidin domain-containing protein [Candidatus Acidoferrum sp.]
MKNNRRLLCLFIGLALFSLSMKGAFAAGAITPFITLEAEAGSLGGGATIHAFTPGSPVPGAPTMELEASGMAYVWLTNVNQSVSWVNPLTNANTIVIRNCIPDAPNGGGITATIDLNVDGGFRQAVMLSSRQSWNYRNSSTTPDDPNGGGTPWHFYNEDRAFITGAPIAAGSTITLQEDSGNTAAFYDIDCIDLENVGPANTQPANSLCITNAPYHADPTFTTDSFAAIQNCVNDARAQGKAVWIPPGKFMINSLTGVALNIRGVTVEGAGMWYSTIYRNVPLPPPTTPWRSEILLNTNSVIRDLFIDSDAIYRGVGGAGGDDSGLASAGANWLAERVWVQHGDAQWMSGSFGTIRDCRVADSWADGINLNNGNTPDSSKLGISLTTSNCFVRGCGDDGLTTYSDSGASGANPQMQNTTIVNNTLVAGYWANGLRIAGGTNVTVQGNLIDSVAANSGMEVSVFGNTGHSLDSALVSGNVIIRGGGWNGNQNGLHVGSPSSISYFSNSFTQVIITNNIIRLALRDGLNIGSTHDTLTVANNTIDHPAQIGIHVQSGVTGTGLFEYNLVTNLNAGQPAFQNDSSSTFAVTLVTNSWQLTASELLSQDQPAIADSTQTGNWATNGNDSNLATRWAANNNQYPHWWRVDLGTNCNLKAVTIDWYGLPGRSYQYTIDVSTNDVDYVTAVDNTGNSSTANTTDLFNATARYVRITVTGVVPSGGSASFYECMVYGSVATSVSLVPTNMTVGVTGNTIALSWPADHLGWHLQVQTNAPGSGLGTNWVTIPGTDQVTGTNLTINPANGAVFYRLTYDTP